MKKFLTVATLIVFIAVAAFPVVSQATCFDQPAPNKKCRKCGQEWWCRPRDGGDIPPKYGCGGNKKKKHDWIGYFEYNRRGLR